MPVIATVNIQHADDWHLSEVTSSNQKRTPIPSCAFFSAQKTFCARLDLVQRATLDETEIDGLVP